MPFDIILFYLFSGLSLFSALMVISLSNAVYSVLFLILVFCNLAGLLLLLGAEFLSFMFLIVYVGAIAVLFLFVVMMLNIKFFNIEKTLFSIFPVGLIIFTTLFLQISSTSNLNFTFLTSLVVYLEPTWVCWISNNTLKTSIEIVGTVLYTKFSFLFLTSSMVLLVAMLGAIVLTMHQRIFVRKQVIGDQLLRNPKQVVKFIHLRK